MGSSLTIDKYGTSIQDWIQIQDKLLEIQFNANLNTHIMIWRIFVDQIDQSLNTSPMLPDNFSTAQNNLNIFSSQQAYVVGFVKKQDYQSTRIVDTNISSIISCLCLNINQKTLQTYIKKGISDDSLNQIKYQYFIYAFMGKRVKNNVKMLALSYCHKLNSFLSNYQRVKVITGGGVYRNKKLQMGSVISFVKKKDSPTKDLSQYSHIHLISQLIGKNSIDRTRNTSNYLFTYKPKLPIPTVTIPQPQQPPTRKSTTQSNHSNQNPTTISTHAQKPIQIPPIKPPMLKLALRTYQEVTYEQVDLEEKNQKFDIRATARHQLKMEKFSNDCSLVVDGLYLSGEKIAKDQDVLRKYNITQIINCAGDYCPNWFQNVRSEEDNQVNKYNYLTFFLKDSQNQNIQCLFYRVIQFINKSISSKKNVLIHCIQGISRSVSFVIAYLIFTNGYDYKKAEAFVKQRRGIACPNNGFMVELIQFHKRLHEKNSLPSPKVFLVSYHCQETPNIITARMIKQRLFESQGKKYVGLDDRGIYIIQGQQILYLWVGAKCEDQKKMKLYWTYAQAFIKKLQQYQKAPLKIKAIHQGNQGKDFLSLWNIEQVPKQYQNPEYDRLFAQQKPIPKAGYLRKHYERQQDQIEQQFLCKLFIYPEHQNGLGVFELEDLTGLCLLVKSDNERVKIFVWNSEDWNGEEIQCENFLEEVIKTNYASYSEDNISIIQEQGTTLPQHLSQQFLKCFS